MGHSTYSRAMSHYCEGHHGPCIPKPLSANEATLSIPRNDHSFENAHGIGKAQKKMALIAWQPRPPEEPRAAGWKRRFESRGYPHGHYVCLPLKRT